MTDQAEAVELSAVERYLAMKEPVKDNPAEVQQPQEETQEVELEGEVEEFTETEEVSEEEELYEVKVNGETFKVPLDELLAGYQKNRDYQQKTQALAAEREAVKQEREILSSLQSRVQKLDEGVAYLEETKKLLMAAAPVVDGRLVETNPAMYIRMKEAREAYTGKIAEIDAQIAAMRQNAEASVAEARRVGALTIKQKMPELTTPEGSQRLYSYLTESYGYPAELIDATVDANLFILAEKARRYDEIMARPKKPTPPPAKVTSSKTAPRPAGDPRTQQTQHLRKQYKETGSLESAAALYASMKK